MKKYKVCVYAIAKNEEKFVKKWVESMSEADEIYVMLDATSSDATEQLLLDAGVHVTKKLIKPWRFDTARNESLKLVPQDADICVCTDLDEVFTKGWRNVLEKTWQPNTNQAGYWWWGNANQPTEPPNKFVCRKIHDRKNFHWVWMIHEYIHPKDSSMTINYVFLKGVINEHHPDLTKPRNYNKLLEEAVELEPDEIYYQQLLVEEYLWRGELEKAGVFVDKIMKNKQAMLNTYNKCFNHKLACQLAYAKGDFKKAKKLCVSLLKEYKDCKWFYGQLGYLQIIHFKEFEEGIENLKKCFRINYDIIEAREMEWNNKAYIANLISIGYYSIKNYAGAIVWVDRAIELCLKEDDLKVYKKNKDLYLKEYKYDVDDINGLFNLIK